MDTIKHIIGGNIPNIRMHYLPIGDPKLDPEATRNEFISRLETAKGTAEDPGFISEFIDKLREADLSSYEAVKKFESDVLTNYIQKNPERPTSGSTEIAKLQKPGFGKFGG